jgi:hypothetical protein
MKYQLIEVSGDGVATHNVDNAKRALSLWYALDGEVQSIRNEKRQEMSLAELREAASNEEASPISE